MKSKNEPKNEVTTEDQNPNEISVGNNTTSQTSPSEKNEVNLSTKLLKKFKLIFEKGNDLNSTNYKYVDLAPTDNADEKGIYTEALTFATTNNNIKNIALTGPYGSGKSSIIKTFLKNKKKKALNISLAAFLTSTNGQMLQSSDTKNEAYTKQEIERNILQQLIYGADASKLPLSRFKRIQAPKELKSQLTTLFMAFWLVVTWYLLQHKTDIINGSFFIPISFPKMINTLLLLFGFITLWQGFRYIYIRSYGISLKSLSLNSLELAADDVKEESILNRHLDEIIYFFQSTNYDLVIIEDLDRFDNTEIFVTLREINSLVNANEGIDRTVRFLYALRDDMFKNTDRTKFFEFIIPVIPIINSSNSIDKVLELAALHSLKDRLDSQFLRDVSRYLNDLRLIRNIFNEYSIYIKNLESNGESNLDKNKLLAVLIYKNIMPSDFENLHCGQGILAEIIYSYAEFITKTETESKEEIENLEAQIASTHTQLPNNLNDLRKIYAMTLISKISPQYQFVNINGQGRVPLNSIIENPDFDNIFSGKYIDCYTQQGHNIHIDVSEIQKAVNEHKTYQQRKKEVEGNAVDVIDTLNAKIRQIRASLSKLRITKFNVIMRTNSKSTDELFDPFGENKELLKYLVFEGYLDDTYYQYTSLFHTGRLTYNDNKFLIKIRGFTNPEPSFQIDNPSEIIASMRKTDFEQNYILNIILVDCLFSDKKKYESQISNLLSFISSNFEESESFLVTYYETGKYSGELLTNLIETWPGFISYAIANPKGNLHIGMVIKNIPESQLGYLSSNNSKFKNHISEKLSEILALGIDLEPNKITHLDFEIRSLSSIESHSAITSLLIEKGMYQLSIDNIEFVLRIQSGMVDFEMLDKKHLTTILKSNNSLLIEKIENEFFTYLLDVLLSLESNSEEDIDTIIKVINHDEIRETYLIEFLEKQSAKLPSLGAVPINLYSKMFQLQKIEPTWQNCLLYIHSQNFDAAILTEYLIQADSIDALSRSNLIEDFGKSNLGQIIVECFNLSNIDYRRYIRVLQEKVATVPSELPKEKLAILIEENKLAFTVENLQFLDDHQDLQVMFLINNIGRYFELTENTMIDDDIRELLLKSEIADSDKLKIIREMDLSLLATLSDRAALIGEILYRSRSTYDNLSYDEAKEIIRNSKTKKIQVELLNILNHLFSDEQVQATLQILSEPYNQITKGHNSPRLSYNKENMELVNILQDRKIISSWKLVTSSKLWSIEQEIKVNLFRN